MARAIEDSKKQNFLLLEFEVDSVIYRFTNWGSDVDPGGLNWLSVPALSVDWPNNEGTLDPGICKVTMQRDANSSIQALADLLVSDGGPSAPVRLTVLERVVGLSAGDEASERTAFIGELTKAVGNANGRYNQVRFEAQNAKSKLQATLGLPCNHHCPWRFMGTGCAVQGGPGARGPQFGVVTSNILISSFSGKTVTLASDPGLSAGQSLRRGYLQVGELVIGVHDWDSGTPTEVILRRQPPASWTGSLALVVPGCDKTLANCQAWSNEANFGGIGYAIPPYNPIYEDGSS